MKTVYPPTNTVCGGYTNNRMTDGQGKSSIAQLFQSRAIIRSSHYLTHLSTTTMISFSFKTKTAGLHEDHEALLMDIQNLF